MKLFELIERSREGRTIQQLCRLYGVTRQGYYAWRNRPRSAHAKHDARLKQAIGELHQGFRRAYGAPRLHRSLRDKGLPCSVRRVNRLMKELGIKASTTGLYQWHPGISQHYSASGNHLAESEPAVVVDVQWAGDFTQVRTGKGWLFHAVVMDLFSRRIIGWSFGRHRNAELTCSALKMALSQRTVTSGCLFHSDQGTEYAAMEYRDLVESAGLIRSMSRKGTPKDNAAVESYFGTLKSELVHQVQFGDQIEATAHIMAYVDFYNRERSHTSIGFQSPLEYERLCA
ncbi:MAG: IS3 family transposase [Pseudomonadota bacterium]